MKFLVVLVAVIAVAIYDYLHDKTIITKAGAWIKYVVAAACGLLYTTISTIPFLSWLPVAGVVVTGAIFWGVISNWAVALYDKVTKKAVAPLSSISTTNTTTV